MAAALPIKNGGTINPMGMPAYKLVCSMSLLHHGDRFGEKRVIATKNNSIAIASVIGHSPTSLS